MNKEIIKKYVTINNINKIAKKEGIILEDYESNIIYNTIINNYQEIIDNPDNTFNFLKNKLNKKTYTTIIKLYNKYKIFLKKI